MVYTMCHCNLASLKYYHQLPKLSLFPWKQVVTAIVVYTIRTRGKEQNHTKLETIQPYKERTNSANQEELDNKGQPTTFEEQIRETDL